jgi:release factor glutamine methyltransferase
MSPSPDHTPPSPAPSSISFQFDAVVARLRVAGCVFAEDEARLLIAGAADLADLETMIDRRVAGLPLEHILGWAEFCGRRIAVDPGVFVPRKRTEFLVQQAVTLARRADGADLRTAPSAVAAQGGPTGPVIVDMCCGSAAVGVALATALGGAELHAVDIDPTAVRCARRNVDTVGGRVYQGDLYDALPGALRGRVDILLANAPYVPTEEIGMMPPEARLFEPRVALDGGLDGLDLQRRVAADASRWLASGGRLLIETSERQAPVSAAILTRAGLIARVENSDDWSATVVVGTQDSARPRRV